MARGAALLLLAVTIGAGGCVDEQEPVTSEQLQGLSAEDRAALLDDDALADESLVADDTKATADSKADVSPDFSCYVSPALYDRGTQIEYWAYARCSGRVNELWVDSWLLRNGSTVGSTSRRCTETHECKTAVKNAPDPSGSQYWESKASMDARSGSQWFDDYGSKAAYY
ncbi:MAG: hypothetical protein WKG01_24965 [Kofleriaceae bacterium]